MSTASAASDNRLTEALEHLDSAFVILDRTWHFAFVNGSAVRPIDLAPSDVIGKNLWEMFPEFRGTTTAEQYHKVMAGRQPSRFEDRSPVNGRWYEISVYPVPEGIAAHWHDVTERKLAELALTESEARARMTAEAALTGLFDWEPLTDRMYWSDQNFRILGLAPGDLEPSYAAWALRVHPDDLPRVEAQLRAAQTERRPYYGVHRVMWPDGSVHVMEARAQFVYDEAGTCTRVRGTYVDITDRALAEQALRDSEERFRLCLRGGNVILALCDPDLRYVWVHNPYPDFDARLVVGKRDTELADNEGTRQLESLKNSVIESRAEAMREIAFPLSTGTEVYHVRAEPRFDSSGNVEAIVTVAVDITARAHAEEALRESQATLQSFYDGAPMLMGIAELDDDQTVAVFGNLAMAEFIGTTPDCLAGHSGRALGTPVDVERTWVENYRRSQQTGAPVRFEVEHPRPNGRCWLSATVSFIGMGPTGRPRFSFVAEDITVRKQAEELHRTNERLRVEMDDRRRLEEQRVDLMRQLVLAQEAERRRVARELHDGLGQHLTALRFGVEAMTAGAADSPEMHSHLCRLHTLAQTLDHEVDRIAADLRPALLDDLGLEDAVRQHVRLWQQETGVATDIHTRGLEDRVAQVIETAVYRVVQEALTNVRKHAHATRASVVVERRDGMLVAIIEDDGVGFHRPTDGDTGSGGGLGLSTMRERAALVGGLLQVESSPGAGTTVYFELVIDG